MYDIEHTPGAPGNGGRNIRNVVVPPERTVTISDQLPNTMLAMSRLGVINGRNIVPLPGHAFEIYHYAGGWILDDEVYSVKPVSDEKPDGWTEVRTLVIDVDNLFTRPAFLADVSGHVLFVATLNACLNNATPAMADAFRQELETLTPEHATHHQALFNLYSEFLQNIPDYERPRHEAIQRFFELASLAPEINTSSPIFRETYHRLRANLATLDLLGR